MENSLLGWTVIPLDKGSLCISPWCLQKGAVLVPASVPGNGSDSSGSWFRWFQFPAPVGPLDCPAKLLVAIRQLKGVLKKRKHHSRFLHLSISFVMHGIIVAFLPLH